MVDGFSLAPEFAEENFENIEGKLSFELLLSWDFDPKLVLGFAGVGGEAEVVDLKDSLVKLVSAFMMP